MKKMCSILLIVCFFLALIPQITLADEEYGDWRYRVLEDGTVEITGVNSTHGSLNIVETIRKKVVSSIDAREGNVQRMHYDIDRCFYFGLGELSLTIPNSIVSIRGNPFTQDIDWYTRQLTINVAPDHPTLEMVNGCLIDKTEKRLIVTTKDYTGEIPEGVKILGAYCGIDPHNPVIPDSVNTIEHGAFQADHYSKVTVTIPNSVTKISGNPFAYNNRNTTISLEKDHPTLELVDGVLYDKAEHRLICATGNKNSYSILPGTEIIEKEAFCRNKASSIKLPDSIKQIGPGAFADTGLTKINITEGVEFVEKGLFCRCGKLTSVTIPNSVKTIGADAFRGCSSLQSITIPDSVISIGEEAFHGCANLKKIVIPEGVASIEGETFMGCSKLQSITIPESITSVGDFAFCECKSLLNITIPDNTTVVGVGAFYNCEKLKEVTIGNGVEDIQVGWVGTSFSGSKNVKSLTITGSIEKWKFSDEFMAKIQTVVLGEGTKSVEPGIFKKFTNLEKVTIPGSVRSIGESAFEGLKKLKSVEIGDGVVTISRNAFADCPNLKKITIPDSVKTIHDSSFNQKQLTMTVGQGSAAEKYCVEHNIKYTYAK